MLREKDRDKERKGTGRSGGRSRGNESGREKEEGGKTKQRKEETETERQTDRLTDRASSRPLTSIGVDRPSLRVVEVGVSTVDREVGVGEGAPRSVEGVAVAVLALLEADLDVHLARRHGRERQLGHVGPHLRRIEKSANCSGVGITGFASFSFSFYF